MKFVLKVTAKARPWGANDEIGSVESSRSGHGDHVQSWIDIISYKSETLTPIELPTRMCRRFHTEHEAAGLCRVVGDRGLRAVGRRSMR